MAAIRITMTSSVIMRLRLPWCAECAGLFGCAGWLLAAGCWGVLIDVLRVLSNVVVYSDVRVWSVAVDPVAVRAVTSLPQPWSWRWPRCRWRLPRRPARLLAGVRRQAPRA